MVKKYKSIKNWESKNFDTIIDVRSPSEFANDHIIGAINCPVLSDKERVNEIAEMLSGDKSNKSANELANELLN